MSTPGTHDLGIASRLDRPRGREIRSQYIGLRVTPDEEKELVSVAQDNGKLLTEWVRDTVFREARKAVTDLALFTEVVALRKLLSNVLRPISTGEKLTPEAYAQIITEVRTGKHDDARALMSQYQIRAGEQ